LDVEFVKQQLYTVRNLNRVHEKQRTLIHEVFMNPATHDAKLIQILVESGVSLTPKTGHPSVLILYLKKAKELDLSLIKLMFENGVNPNPKIALNNPLYELSKRKDASLAAFKLLIEYGCHYDTNLWGLRNVLWRYVYT